MKPFEKMTRVQRRKRRSALIKVLCELSRDGWRNAIPADYLPLEAELRLLEDTADDRPQ